MTEEDKGNGQQEAAAEAAELELLKQTLAQKEAEAQTNFDRWLRAVAELENYKKRVSKEQEEFKRYAIEGLARGLLPAIDNLERAISHAGDAEGTPLTEGVRMTLHQFLKSLEAFGITPYPSLGEAFDPNRHEAMEVTEVADGPANVVVEEHRRGYMIRDRVLRPALVTVTKRASMEPEPLEQKLYKWTCSVVAKHDPGVEVLAPFTQLQADSVRLALRKENTELVIGASREYLHDHDDPAGKFEDFIKEQLNALEDLRAKGLQGRQLGAGIGHTGQVALTTS